ncbi:hypothetical protein SOVF_126520 [Spinacia oleracea]|nr:hypothetical protein SOVF_126520 [Spinacia oleracea]
MAKIGSQKEFEAAFQKLRGKDADITHEAAEIQVLVVLSWFFQFDYYYTEALKWPTHICTLWLSIDKIT